MKDTEVCRLPSLSPAHHHRPFQPCLTPISTAPPSPTRPPFSSIHDHQSRERTEEVVRQRICLQARRVQARLLSCQPPASRHVAPNKASSAQGAAVSLRHAARYAMPCCRFFMLVASLCPSTMMTPWRAKAPKTPRQQKVAATMPCCLNGVLFFLAQWERQHTQCRQQRHFSFSSFSHRRGMRTEGNREREG